VVRDAHLHVCHNGVKETLTEVRSRLWIVKAQSLTRAVMHRCKMCKKFEGAPFEDPPPPPLPEFRIKEDPAFTYTGVGFAGPLFARSGYSNGSSKVWICVFTCLVTRATHPDIVCDLSTDIFLPCLKRFAADEAYLARSYLTMGRHLRLLQSSSVLSSKMRPYKNTWLIMNVHPGEVFSNGWSDPPNAVYAR